MWGWCGGAEGEHYTVLVAAFPTALLPAPLMPSCPTLDPRYGLTHPFYFSSELAPGPSDVNWPALWCSWRQAFWRGLAAVPLHSLTSGWGL